VRKPDWMLHQEWDPDLTDIPFQESRKLEVELLSTQIPSAGPIPSCFSAQVTMTIKIEIVGVVQDTAKQKTKPLLMKRGRALIEKR
jgi:hypothetical protein